jgi:hypothetical protein
VSVVILTPVGRYLSTDHQRCIDGLKGSVPVLREYGITCVDQARSILLERALATDADVFLWIDDDIAFDPKYVAQLAERCRDGAYDVLGVAYARRLAKGGMSVRFTPETKVVRFFQPGTQEVVSLGFGFTAMRRAVAERLVVAVPRVRIGVIRSGDAAQAMISPMFAARVVDGTWLPDDESFCLYARALGYRIGIDLEPRIWHVGAYNYGLEDAVGGVQRAGILNVELKVGPDVL